ncbi:MAG: hypothetical protein V4663_06110 [Bacteroidota bacterium]
MVETTIKKIQDEIISTVCRALSLERRELSTPSRKAPYPDARFICYKLMHEKGLTSAEMALPFRRDHSSAEHGLKQYTNRLESRDKVFAEMVAKVNAEMEVQNEG